MPTKQEILQRVYYDRKTGFGSFQDTLKQAKFIDNSITVADVRSFLEKQEVRQVHKPQHAYNSFVAPGAREQFQIDVADFGKYAHPRYGLVAVDVFTKKMDVEPMGNKQPATTAHALDNSIHDMGLPNSIAHDEGGEFESEFAQRVKYFDADDIRIRTRPRFVD